MSYDPQGDTIRIKHISICPVFPHSPVSVTLEGIADEFLQHFEVDGRIFITPPRSEKKGPRVGTVSKVLQINRGQNDSVRIVFEGVYRAQMLDPVAEPGDFQEVDVVRIPTLVPESPRAANLYKILRDKVEHLQKNYSILDPRGLESIMNASYPNNFVDMAACYFDFNIEHKIALLEETNLEDRLELLLALLDQQATFIELKAQIDARTRAELQEHQKEYFLQEQIRQIHKELGREDEEEEIQRILDEIREKKPPQDVMERAEKEAHRLEKLQPTSPEAGVVRTYLDCLAALPWSSKSRRNPDIARARKILDEDHYDMQKVKERILDSLAVRQLNPKARGAILCFVGPPGTGKTSLGKSIARSLGREFVRISLGGVRDEAEIRGHRRTYIGAMPGKIIQALKKSKKSNPVFLLDELDKLGSDFKGDPASALLEVLDPEQNKEFVDHYLEVPYDLSQVFFIATANTLHTIPKPLLDRMEVLEIPGYSDLEKLQIAKNFLVPKQMKLNGLGKSKVKMSDEAIRCIIEDYTRESGVRSLERNIATTIRKVGREFLENHKISELSSYKKTISPKTIEWALGVARFTEDEAMLKSQVGVVNGLAWTEAGGRVLRIEAALLEGKGNLILTGNLGDVMKESARIAYSYVLTNAKKFGIEDMSLFSEHHVHIHVPQGAIPKDGPSAGISMLSALVSLFTAKPLHDATAMTGELTLSGNVTAIGGVKEKVLAAHRNGMKWVLLPRDNEKDALEELPEEVCKDIEIVYVANVNEAMDFLLKKEQN